MGGDTHGSGQCYLREWAVLPMEWAVLLTGVGGASELSQGSSSPCLTLFLEQRLLELCFLKTGSHSVELEFTIFSL